MKVIWFNGNFGNQIFYCAYKDYLNEKYPKERIFAYIDPKCPPVLVEERTNLLMPNTNSLVTILSFFVFKVLGVIFRRIPAKYVPKWYCGKDRLDDHAMFIEHSMQSKSFYEEKESSWLEIRNNASLSSDYLAFEKQIIECDAICIHIRRGDYVKPGSLYANLADSDYYEKAIQQARIKYPQGKLFFFSDDLEYVKGRFKDEEASYVNCNSGKDGYLDIKLMSLAKVNIIANSTFSYWGAYIGHENKFVFYPKRWFTAESGRVAPDIMLNKSNWIGI